ncbi:GNAT family N-acetyltransferase [Anabaena cylindrica FACHB-243]|uniref:Acetyltransferase, GNAT family n=1 Tax=Anabaena cylindrica (strain ATCC 27899 / PCC 7122) TaxID=272123 RepID=K9ZDE2_ANACC|nr:MULTISPECIES: GNAT family N-acetyltransferase [Anabaena]AFZ56632.1 Acetyltransferase, GNAT family [Anabaena cylindrica PCC 7122]MBD2416196.1 GNAT family N-acetyltransferase [Anabaena cylindrica FACHB-243]MBY5284788.1 GNAT family N-acetyltransferase [Anabaena sp. CCAP 1446/1C]MCM2408925.1 GNAT family N-acetyltransferase [Anabaena sp. CCAP 1446/1C]BAY00916.1 GCN5-related N-acetyltransferase [Anabaena cylindrica PCC 7122]
MKLRSYRIEDTPEIINLFNDTIHNINVRDYSKEQVEAWASAKLDIEMWINRLSNSFTYVAEENNQIIGFSNLEKNGHIDCFYCHHAFQRQGVGTKILDSIELQAKFLGITKLFTEASITAKPFFISKNFIVVKEQEVECRGQLFINFVMEKTIESFN